MLFPPLPSPGGVTDLNEHPAVPPMETGGDVRYGFLSSGVVLLVGGWGILLGLNLWLHRIAGPDGVGLGVIRVYGSIGPLAEASALLGAGAGAVGLVLLYYGLRSPKGAFVLPGAPY